MTNEQLQDKIMQRKFELLQTTGLLNKESLILYLDEYSFSQLFSNVRPYCMEHNECSPYFIYNGMKIFVVETKEEHINVCVY